MVRHWVKELADNAASRVLNPTTVDMNEVNRQRGAYDAMVTFLEELDLVITQEEEEQENE